MMDAVESAKDRVIEASRRFWDELMKASAEERYQNECRDWNRKREQWFAYLSNR